VPVAAPSDKRFRRAQVKPARRKKAWALRVLAVARVVVSLVAFVAGGWLLTQQVADAKGLRVDRITIRGNDRLATREALALIGAVRGEHVLTVDLDAWQARLQESPWVEQASLRRVFPSTIEVTIAERQPMALGRVGDHLYLVDAGGRIIDEYGPTYAQMDLPIVDGLADAQDGAPLVDEARAALAARLIAALRRHPALFRKVSQIDVRNDRDAVVLLEGDQARLRLGDDRFAERLQAYLELAPALRQRVPDIDYVDMRFENRVYVRPGTTVRPATASKSGVKARRAPKPR
jgi:cell division protein FtsQ